MKKIESAQGVSYAPKFATDYMLHVCHLYKLVQQTSLSTTNREDSGASRDVTLIFKVKDRRISSSKTTNAYNNIYNTCKRVKQKYKEATYVQ